MFRFTIRDLLLLTVIVALVVSWWVDRSRLAADRDSLQRTATELRRVTDDQQGMIAAYSQALMAVPQDAWTSRAKSPNSSAADSKVPTD
jgi:hypothetical protein